MTWILTCSQPIGKDCPKAAKEPMAGGTPKKKGKEKNKSILKRKEEKRDLG